MIMRSIKRFAWLAQLAFVAGSVTGAKAQTVLYKYANVDNIKIFYREAGDPKKPTVLLLHGFPSSSHMYRDLIPALSGRFHVLAPDYPGMGNSDAPPADQFTATFDSITAVVEKFVEQSGAKHVIIYMQDFGGPVGMRLAVKHPDWIAGLIFQNTPISLDGWDPARLKAVQANSGPVTPEKRAAAEGRVTLNTAIFLYQHGARNPAGLNPDAWVNDAYALGKPDNKRIMTDLQLDIPSNLDLYPDWQTYLRTQKPRTLVEWGTGDPLFPKAGAEAVKKEVPNAEMHFYNTGHFALEENNAEIAHDILGFFAR